MIKKIIVCLALVMSFVPLCARHDVIVEGKAAYFFPTNSRFRDIYGNGSGQYGAEVTFRLFRQLYGFTSADFFNKKGKSINFCNSTTVNIINVGIGLKYLVPFCVGDFYVGLGALPTRLHTTDCSPYVIKNRTKWGCGGIAKVGAYFDLPKSFVIDVFADYSFVKIPFNCCPKLNLAGHSAHANGLSVGAGVGYRFN